MKPDSDPGMISFDELEGKIGLTIANPELLIEAFTHGSIIGKALNKASKTYRRLEFLGDAVIRLVASESVYRASNGSVEKLHDTRESLVPNGILTDAGKKLDLVKYMRSSGSQDVMKSRLVLAKLYESLTGAIFLDKGYLEASKFVEKTLILEKNRTGLGSPSGY